MTRPKPDPRFDHMPIADEWAAFRNAYRVGLVGVLTVALVGLMLLFVAQGPKIIKKIAHQIDQVQQ